MELRSNSTQPTNHVQELFVVKYCSYLSAKNWTQLLLFEDGDYFVQHGKVCSNNGSAASICKNMESIHWVVLPSTKGLKAGQDYPPTRL